MNPFEYLLLIGRMLAMRGDPSTASYIKDRLALSTISWEQFVWIGSQHRILPALYIHLAEQNLLDLLPDDLTDHLQQLHYMNTIRNQALLEQVYDITNILNANGITPIYIKGIAHTLQNLYSDPGERMIGDIDFLVQLDEIPKTVELMGSLGYSNPTKLLESKYEKNKHYPRLRNPEKMAGVEIHRQPVSSPYDKVFNLEFLQPKLMAINSNGSVLAPSYIDQIIHNAMNAQMNDFGFKKRRINLRHSYDLFLLSNRASVNQAVSTLPKYRKQVAAHITMSFKLFNKPTTLELISRPHSSYVVNQTVFMNKRPTIYKTYIISFNIIQRLKRYVIVCLKITYDRETRVRLSKQIKDPKWYRAHLESYRSIISS